ncbi:MAG TPA: hypothetical protein VJX74_14020 [Blastocatellia bacterium]|nr:hypothetical protein [Blastocatellia bacterium]
MADARRQHNSAARALAGVERQISDLLPAKLRIKPHRAILRGLKSHPYKLDKYLRLRELVEEQEVLLQQAAADFQQQARDYINTAFTEHGPDIGDILAHLAPTRTAAPHHALNVAANTYRYHEGTVLDPIPIIWYKPQNQYPNLALNAYDGAGNLQNFNLAYPGGGTVYDRAPGPNRIRYDFGIAGGNQVPGNAVANAFDIRNARQAYTRTTQQELNQVIQNFGFNMNNRDGDHVKDLGFGGLDRIDNFWPLPRAVNQRAMVWRQAYRFHFKEQDNHGNWVLRSGTVNGLPGKYFRIKGEENQDVPAESNGVAAGNNTTYGNAQVVDVNGVNVQEA